MDMGTGKTRVAIELVVRRWDRISKVVVCCPVSLKETWRREIMKHVESPSVYVFGERTSSDRLPAADWYVVGLESISQSDRQTLALYELVDEQSMIIVDESGYIKNHRAVRTRRLLHIGKTARYRLVLTGTPISNGVEDLFAQMKFLSPRILGYRSFYAFARNHLEYHPDYPGLVVETHNEDYLAARMRPYVFQVTKDEALELPEKIHERRYLSLTAEQEALYEQAKEELLMRVDPFEISSRAIFRLFTALQQITCGFWNRRVPDKVTDEFGMIHWPLDCSTLPQEHHYPDHERLGLLRDVLREISAREGENEKVIIWARYHFCVREIARMLGAEYGPGAFSELHGDLSDAERTQELDAWRASCADGGRRFLIATPETGSHGLTLTEARYAVFYNNTFNYADRLQAEDRIHRIGQTRRPTYIDLVCSGTIDDRIMEALSKKEDVLRAFRAEVEAVKHQKGEALEELATTL